MSQREPYQLPGYSQTQGSNNNANASFSNNNNETNADPSNNFSNGASNNNSSNGGNPQTSFTRTQPSPQPTRGAFGHRPAYNTPDNKVYYTCGDCGQKQGFQANNPLRCGKCGCRTLYKVKTDRWVEVQVVGRILTLTGLARFIQFQAI